jgi:hypothetical protein
MKKNKFQKLFLAELEKVPIVQVGCEKTNLSRNTIYRWRKEDPDFAKRMDDSLAQGESLINDMGETQLLNLIKEKSWPALSFWLRHRNPKFKDKLEVTAKIEKSDALSPEQEILVREALRLSTVQVADNNQNDNKENEQQPNSTNITTDNGCDDQRSQSQNSDN